MIQDVYISKSWMSHLGHQIFKKMLKELQSALNEVAVIALLISDKLSILGKIM
jgi:hypothetical protein